MICGDGTLLTLQLDAAGRVDAQLRSEQFFDPDVDPIIENGAPIDGVWYFPSYGGDVYPVDLSGGAPSFGEKWALVDHSVEPAGWFASLVTLGKAGPWLPGGYQLATVHEGRRQLFVLTHPIAWSEGEGDHVFPGAEVWGLRTSTSANARSASSCAASESPRMSHPTRTRCCSSAASTSRPRN